MKVRRTWRNNDTQVRLTVVPSPSSRTFTFTKTKPNQTKTKQNKTEQNSFSSTPTPGCFQTETETETEWVPFASLSLFAASKRKKCRVLWFSKRKMRAYQFEDTSKANPRANLSSLLLSSLLSSSLLFSSLVQNKTDDENCAIQGTFCNPKGIDWKETEQKKKKIRERRVRRRTE